MTHLTVGATIAEAVVQLSRADLRAYASASGDHNPIHHDDAIAHAVGLPGVIAHGMLTMGHAARIVSDATGGAWHVKDISVRFTRPVVVPAEDASPAWAEVHISATVTAIDDVTGDATLAINATFNGQTVLARAHARATLNPTATATAT